MTKIKLIGGDGNVFNIMGLVYEELKKDGKRDQADKFKKEAFNSGSYEEVLRIADKYVEIE